MEPRPPGDASVLTDYEPPSDRDPVGRHVALFLATLASTIWCGGYLVGRGMLWDPPEVGLPAPLALFLDPTFLGDGLRYAIPFLGFLTVHEFGHYLAARRWRTRVSLPYFIPVPLPGTFGTFGAVIQIKQVLRRTRQLFDIGAAGPLAGAVVAVTVLVVAVLTLPSIDYLLGVGHVQEVAAYHLTGSWPALDPATLRPGEMAFVIGDTPLYRLIASLGPMRVPGEEVLHYPLLLAGWLGLFFTALNLLPVGQLDGGHVVYALFGPAVHRVVARVTTLLLMTSGAIGLATSPVPLVPAWALWPSLVLGVAVLAVRMFGRDVRLVAGAVAVVVGGAAVLVFAVPGLAAHVGWSGWLFWSALIVFVIRVDHPPVGIAEALTPRRKALGYLCLVLFALSFSIQPFQLYAG